MKSYLWLLFLLLPEMMGAQQRVTLAQCYEWAEANYPQIRQLGWIDRAEKYDLSNAWKSLLPQLSMQAKASYQSEVTSLPLDFSQLPVDITVPTLSKDQYQVAAEVTQTIWDGGLTRSGKALTRAQANVSRKELETELYALKERVNQLYFGYLLQQDLLRQNRLLQKELQVNLERVETLIANGMANESDRDLLEVELLNVHQREAEIEASRAAFIRMLAWFTGQKELEKQELLRPELPAMQLSEEVFRPELEVLQAQNMFLTSRDKAITAGIMPRVGAFVQAGYGRPGLNMLENEFSPFYIAGVRVNWNLGKLYTLKNDRRQVEVARRKLDVSRETFLFNTRMQLISQNEEIWKLTRLIQSDDEIIRLRARVKKAAEAKLANGVIAVSDLIREINAEDMARQTAAIHQTQHLMAIYQLMYLTNNK